MAHSFIQAHALETDAFRNFAAQDVVLLIDTYDTLRGARRAAELCKSLRRDGVRVRGVRIDSGDLELEARRVRGILDAEDCREVRIFVSGGIDEHSIATMRAAQAPIDAFCIGTRLSVSADAPSLDCAYKLQQYAGRPCRKRSQWKETWPGPRQVYRQYDEDDRIGVDVLGCADEVVEGKPMLQLVMHGGRRVSPPAPLDVIRHHCAEELASLPTTLRALEKTTFSPVKISDRQHALATEVDRVAR
jgi:nicotinate phosphoribosyltransferase